MATFTLPHELRSLCQSHPTIVYNLLLSVSAETLITLAGNDMKLSHTRRLDFHPHVLVVIPGSAVHKERCQWRKASGDYLFNGEALATVFRAIMNRRRHPTLKTYPRLMN